MPLPSSLDTKVFILWDIHITWVGQNPQKTTYHKVTQPKCSWRWGSSLRTQSVIQLDPIPVVGPTRERIVSRCNWHQIVFDIFFQNELWTQMPFIYIYYWDEWSNSQKISVMIQSLSFSRVRTLTLVSWEEELQWRQNHLRGGVISKFLLSSLGCYFYGAALTNASASLKEARCEWAKKVVICPLSPAACVHGSGGGVVLNYRCRKDHLRRSFERGVVSFLLSNFATCIKGLCADHPSLKSIQPVTFSSWMQSQTKSRTELRCLWKPSLVLCFLS